MALEEDMMNQEQPKTTPSGAEGLNEEEQRDLNIGVMLAQDLIDSGGIEVIQKAEQSKDPVR